MILNDLAIILLSLCFTIIPTIFQTIINKKFLLSPTNFISLTSFLYLNGWIFYKNSIGENLDGYEYLLYIIPFLFLSFFHLGSLQNIKSINLPRIKINHNILFQTGYLIYFLSLFLFIVIIIKYGFSFFLLGKGLRNLTYLNSGIEKYAKNLLLSSTFLLSYLFIKGFRKSGFIFALMYILSLFFLFLLEVRSGIAILIFSSTYFYHFFRKKLSNTYLYLSTIFLFILGISAKPTFYYLLRPFSELSLEKYFLKVSFYISNFLNNSEFHSWFKILNDVKFDFYSGNLTFNSIKSFFIPSLLGGDSFSSTNWYAEKYLPELSQKGIGRGFSFLVESYLDWTLIGMCLLAFIYGAFLAYCEKHSHHYICGFATSTFPFIWTGNVSLLIKNYFFFYFFVPAIIYIILSLIIPYKNKSITSN